jgi:hypothetical protein
MARTKGSSNKKPPAAPDTVEFTTEQRLAFIANLIVDRILQDKANELTLLKQIGSVDDS